MTECSDTASPSLDRRTFLKGAALSAGAAGAAAVGVAATRADAKATDETTRGAGYQETDHVRRAYELAAF